MKSYKKFFIIFFILHLILGVSYATITLEDITDLTDIDLYTDYSQCFFKYTVILRDYDNNLPILATIATTPTIVLAEEKYHMPHVYVYILTSENVNPGSGVFQFQASNGVNSEIFNLNYVCELRPTTIEIEFFKTKFNYMGSFTLPYPSVIFKVNNFNKAKQPILQAAFTGLGSTTFGNPTIQELGANFYQLYIPFSPVSQWADIGNDLTVAISYSMGSSSPTVSQTISSFLNDYQSRVISMYDSNYYIDPKSVYIVHLFNLQATHVKPFIRNPISNGLPSLVSGNSTDGLYFEVLFSDTSRPQQEYRYLDQQATLSNSVSNLVIPAKFTVADFKNESSITFNENDNLISSLFRSNATFVYFNTEYNGITLTNQILSTSWPFGYGSGNSKDYFKEIDFMVSRYSTAKFKFNAQTSNYELLSQTVDTIRTFGSIDDTPPTVHWYSLFYMDLTMILQLNITDDISGFGHLSDNLILCSYSNLVTGTPLNGIYEINFDISQHAPSLYGFDVCDRAGNCAPFYIFGYSDSDEPGHKLPISKIQNITFEPNDIDVSNQSVKTNMFVKINKLDTPTPPVLYIIPQASTIYDLQFRYATYNDFLGSYVFPIEIHKNHPSASLTYTLKGLSFIDYQSVFGSNAELRITSSMGDALAPLITNVDFPNGGNVFVPTDSLDSTIKWRLSIQDTVNGFKSGEIVVKNSLDLVEYSFLLKPNKKNYMVSGDKYNGVYEFSVPVNGKCKDQQFRITSVKLTDENRYSSNYNYSFQIGAQNPFTLLSNNLEYYTTINVTCEYGDVDNTPPKLVSFDFNPKVVDVTSSGILNQTSPRIVTFDFVTYDESGIMLNALPRIYLTDDVGVLVDKVATLKTSNETHAVYQCQFEIPYGFGFNGVIKVSLYGIVDNQSNFKGYPSSKLLVNTITPSTNIVDTKVAIFSASELSSLGGNLNLKGIRFALNDKILIEDHQFNTITTVQSFNSSLTYMQFKNIQPISKTIPFIYITIQRELIPSNYQYSNSLKVFITDYQEPGSSSAEEYSSDSNVPTNPVQECINDCSGNGDCTSKGCVCKPTWIGLDCSSQIIIVPPKINDTIPETNFTIPKGNDKAIYYAVISVVGLNEIGNDGSVVNRYTFNQWIANNNTNSKYKEFTNSTGYLYTTSLLNANDQSTTNLNVSIDYFNIQEPVNITFANQLFIMNPYSLKYSINITQYQFKSSLNSLQLILSATIESNDNGDECSSKQTGTTVESESQFIKMQINDHSLYGRFIKRGIIDNRIKLVTNTFLDSEYNVMDTTSKSQSYIGINIPFYNRLAQLDPDFSVLIDHKPASESDNSICTPSKSKLSKAQIAGIVIGAFGFVAIIVTSVVYYFYKKRQAHKFSKDIQAKLGKLQS